MAGTPFATPQAPDGGTGPAAAEGYWAFVHPLPPGHHVVRVYGTAFAGGFVQDVRYCITVTPGKKRGHPGGTARPGRPAGACR